MKEPPVGFTIQNYSTNMQRDPNYVSNRGNQMKVRAERIPSGDYELFLEIDPIKLPVLYSSKDLEVLERNGVIRNRNSYNAGTLVKFNIRTESEDKIEQAILDTVTECH